MPLKFSISTAVISGAATFVEGGAGASTRSFPFLDAASADSEVRATDESPSSSAPPVGASASGRRLRSSDGVLSAMSSQQVRNERAIIDGAPYSAAPRRTASSSW